MKTSKSSLDGYLVVKSKSGIHPECGYPIGQFLVRNYEIAQEAIKKSGMTDPEIIPYEDYVST